MPKRNAETDRSLLLSFMHERKLARRKPACRPELMLLTKAECMHSGMNEGMLARRPGKAPCPLPPTTPSPVCVRSALPRPLADSCDPRLVTFCCRPCWQGEGGLRRPAGLHVRAHTCVHRSCSLSGYPPARAHACVHSFMHERMVYSRKACRVGLPLSFVGGLANGDVDFRLHSRSDFRGGAMFPSGHSDNDRF